MREENRRIELRSDGLHVLAMGLMLCDHMWAMLFPAAEWMTCIGRMAYPIFAFMIAEGYTHTHDLRRYLLRMLGWAVVSEIPFDLMCGGSVFYPYHQNVLWTFLISLLTIRAIEVCRARFQPAPAAVLAAGAALLSYVLGYAAMVDYYGVGVLMVLVFYLFRQRNWQHRLAQLLCLYLLNVKLLGGYFYSVRILGHEVELVQQGFALFALIPIWLYRGGQGRHSKGFQVFCYAFYPVHMLLLFAVQAWMLR